MSNSENAQVQVSRSFPVSKERLYKAWTEPEELKKWWKPMGKTLKAVENDIREGGQVRYSFEDGLEISGEYKQVDAGSKLVYSWIWQIPQATLHNGDYLLTVAFNEEGEQSSLSVTQENFAQEHAIKPHEEGWQEALDALQHHLSK